MNTIPLSREASVMRMVGRLISKGWVKAHVRIHEKILTKKRGLPWDLSHCLTATNEMIQKLKTYLLFPKT